MKTLTVAGIIYWPNCNGGHLRWATAARVMSEDMWTGEINRWNIIKWYHKEMWRLSLPGVLHEYTRLVEELKASTTPFPFTKKG